MPVISEPYHDAVASLPGVVVSSSTYLLIGAVLLTIIGVFINQRTKSRSRISAMSSNAPSEKEGPSHPEPQSQSQSHSAPVPAASLSQRPPPPPPFTPPMLDPTEMNFSSFEPFESVMEMPPRRRSYTKTTTDGVEVSGEIISAGGFRRHTKVFGGGVCEACLESERMMSA